MKKGFLIAAASSGSGKTTLTMGIMRALCRRGLTVQPFKCGPDYIDTRYHEAATGRPSVNLDTWLASADHVRELYSRYGTDADLCITEGVMGLYDGYDRACGSSAEIAATINAPVVIVASAQSASYTLAAQLSGLQHFRPGGPFPDGGLRFAGVIFNKVGSARHERLLRQAAEDAGLQCLGAMPRLASLEIPSRHLGLQLSDRDAMAARADAAADFVEQYVDLTALAALSAPDAGAMVPERPAAPAAGDRLRIAVACDAAFNFIYRENVARLERMGQVVFFSPLAGDDLPQADLVWFPGGYPELFAGELSKRTRLMRQVRDYAEASGRILAECGGMIWLSQAIQGVEGGPYPMCGILPFAATMEGARLHMGYRRLVDASGRTWKGHEFHYSTLTAPDALPSVACQWNAAGEQVPTPLYRYMNVIAGYTHLYWGESDILNLWN